MNGVVCRIKDYIQPFERHLAILELRAIAGNDLAPIDRNWETASLFRVAASVGEANTMRRDLAYWESVDCGSPRMTVQLRSEATSIIARNGISLRDLPELVPQLVESKRPEKRCLRYGPHGLHEYRGKFFPQLVRALINTARVPRGGIVLDPMCGSGTTLVEAVLSGRSAYGLDMNPLSAFVTDVKCRALGLHPKVLIDTLTALSERLSRPTGKLDPSGRFASLPESDQNYLQRWFAFSTLEELDHIEFAIRGLRGAGVRNLFKVCLSNILRGVSWQKDDDLRVRKEVTTLLKGEVIGRFLQEATRSTKTLVAFLADRGRDGLGSYVVTEADARTSAHILHAIVGKVDAVVTSPPYATALPYLDTDRLSLIYLGLLQRGDHRGRDILMIGNREITERVRADCWSAFETSRQLLPLATQSLIERIDRLNKKGEAGFRRRNLSALLAKYFFDMRMVLAEQMNLLRPGGTLFLVVGNNRTTAGGEIVEIRTAEQLALIAESLGFRFAGDVSMEMLASRDIFRKNAMPSEHILTLQKPQ
jgi:site-specific DNA-methyltransferase (cytosine-N4-specific)